MLFLEGKDFCLPISRRGDSVRVRHIVEILAPRNVRRYDFLQPTYLGGWFKRHRLPPASSLIQCEWKGVGLPR